jgi:hypothetical protein
MRSILSDSGGLVQLGKSFHGVIVGRAKVGE